MFLMTDNSLFLTDPQQRGQGHTEVLQNVQNLPQNLRLGLLKVLVLPEKAENGQTQLQLPNGQVFTADIPENIPAGSQLLVQLGGRQQFPQILRVLLPQTAEQPAQIRPSQTPPVLLDVAANMLAAEGQTVRFQVPQNSAFLPTAGISVMGRTLTFPQAGGQTLSLTNGQQLSLLVPPVFDVGSEVVLKIGQHQTAVVDKLRLPQQPPSLPTTTTPPPVDGEAVVLNQGQPRQLLLDRQAPPAPATPLQGGRVMLPTPFKLVPQQPIPQNILQNTQPQLATVQQYAPNTVTLGLQNGVLLTFDIPDEVLQNRLGFQPQTTTQQVQPPQTMAIRFTDSGLLEVLSTVSPRPVQPPAGRNPDHQPQQFPNPSGQTAPTKAPVGQSQLLSAGHIATGTVVEQRAGGEVVLQFGQDVRTTVLAQRLLPVGSQISVHIMADGHAEILDITLPKGSERSNALLRFSLQWDTLNQALNTLEENNPAGFEKLKRALPKANETLLPKLLQLSQSITQQNMRAFFGDEVLNILRALGLDGMLQNDAAQLNNLHQKADTPEGWRALLFPYLDDQETLRQGGFFWRRHKKESANDETSLRFVLNVHMSSLGTVQLDGLMQGKDVMHLKLRLTQDLAPEDLKGLETLVQKTLAAVGLHGTLHVETVTFFETDPLHDMLLPPNNDTPPNRLNVEA